jgi:hypothetical protein
VICVVLAVLWLPFRAWFDRGEPVAEIIAASGLQGLLTALTAVAIGAMQKQRNRRDLPSPTPAQSRTSARRGAIVGLGVGVPFFGGLALLCLTTGRSLGYTVVFSVALAGIAATVAKSLRGAASTP